MVLLICLRQTLPLHIVCVPVCGPHVSRTVAVTRYIQNSDHARVGEISFPTIGNIYQMGATHSCIIYPTIKFDKGLD